MIEQLFGSKTRVKLLRLFYSNPNRSFFVREITRKIDEQINSVRRELSNLQSVGIITSDGTKNKLYYEVNQKYEYYDPLRIIFGEDVVMTPAQATETVEGEQPKKKAVPKTAAVPSDLQILGNIELALYTGKFTRDDSAGIDFLVVGDVNRTQLQKYVTELEVKEGKEIRYAVFSVDDFHYREQIHDRFITAIKEAKKQILVDKQHLLS